MVEMADTIFFDVAVEYPQDTRLWCTGSGHNCKLLTFRKYYALPPAPCKHASSACVATPVYVTPCTAQLKGYIPTMLELGKQPSEPNCLADINTNLLLDKRAYYGYVALKAL